MLLSFFRLDRWRQRLRLRLDRFRTAPGASIWPNIIRITCISNNSLLADNLFDSFTPTVHYNYKTVSNRVCSSNPSIIYRFSRKCNNHSPVDTPSVGSLNKIVFNASKSYFHLFNLITGLIGKHNPRDFVPINIPPGVSQFWRPFVWSARQRIDAQTQEDNAQCLANVQRFQSKFYFGA